MEITANAIQTVAANQNVQFTETAVCGNCNIMHRNGSGNTTLRAPERHCARFRVSYNGNIAVPTGQTVGAISMAIASDGEPIQSTNMIVTPAAVEEYFNVSAQVEVQVPCGCCMTIAVENTSTIPVNVQNSNLIVTRVC